MATDIIARAIAAGKADLVDGKVPPSQLPSYVDDVVNYNSRQDFPSEGEIGKIYVDNETGYTYRWTGTMYMQIGLTLLDDKIGLVELIGSSGALSQDEFASAGKAFAQIRIGSEVFIKALEDSDVIQFRSTVIPDTETLVGAVQVTPHRITINKATQAWTYETGE